MLFLFVTWWAWCLLLSFFTKINSFCSNDEHLQRHRCICSVSQRYIQCSSLPSECRTCYRYDTIFFDKHVNILPSESFHFYDLFNYNNNKSFTIQFAQLDGLSSNTFSKINVKQNRRLSIKISQYSSSVIPTRIFDDMEIQLKAKLDFEIFNVTSSSLTIEQYAFDGIKYDFQSEFRFSIIYLQNIIEFQSNAGKLFLAKLSIQYFPILCFLP